MKHFTVCLSAISKDGIMQYSDNYSLVGSLHMKITNLFVVHVIQESWQDEAIANLCLFHFQTWWLVKAAQRRRFSQQMIIVVFAGCGGTALLVGTCCLLSTTETVWTQQRGSHLGGIRLTIMYFSVCVFVC